MSIKVSNPKNRILNKTEANYTFIECRILHTTERAYLVKIDSDDVWIAKSQSIVEPNGLLVINWLAKKIFNQEVKIVNKRKGNKKTKTIDELSDNNLEEKNICPYCCSEVEGVRCNFCGSFIGNNKEELSDNIKQEELFNTINNTTENDEKLTINDMKTSNYIKYVLIIMKSIVLIMFGMIISYITI